MSHLRAKGHNVHGEVVVASVSFHSVVVFQNEKHAYFTQNKFVVYCRFIFTHAACVINIREDLSWGPNIARFFSYCLGLATRAGRIEKRGFGCKSKRLLETLLCLKMLIILRGEEGDYGHGSIYHVSMIRCIENVVL